MSARAKRIGPRAVAAARKAKNVGFGKATAPLNPGTRLEANAYARAWVARRCRVQARWASIIAEAAGLGGRP